MQTSTDHIIIFVYTATIIVFSLAALIITLLFLYRRRHIKYERELEALKLNYEKNILKSQVEIQEQTFAIISREIHDNINLSLTLAKLNLNMLDWKYQDKAKYFVDSSVAILSEAISNLRDLSRSMNPVIIRHQGFLNAIEKEVLRIQNSTKIPIELEIHGEAVFMDCEKELVMFRIIQEAFNNIIRHAHADLIKLKIFYEKKEMKMSIKDNGVGLSEKVEHLISTGSSAGLLNMKTRANMFGGKFELFTQVNEGTEILISIPY
jgi:two-component system, NarL family, sensor kinase